MKRVFAIVFTVICAMIVTTAASFACTAVYVGKDATADGTAIFARSEDQMQAPYNKMFKVQKRVKKAGRTFVDTGTGAEFKLPELTYKYTYVPDSSDAGDGMYPACCNNEYGMGVVGTVSTEVSDAYAELDPIIEDGGLREAVLPALIVCQSKTAREGVDVLGKLIEEYGSAENNTFFLYDTDESWIMETYGGKTWCAMKLPTDQACVFGNQNMIGVVDESDTENFVFSPTLFETIEKAGNVVKDENGHIDLVQSITGYRDEHANLRTWRGHVLLGDTALAEYQPAANSEAKEEPVEENDDTGIIGWIKSLLGGGEETAKEPAPGEFNNDIYYPLMFTPAEKVNLTDVFAIYRDRYADTDFDITKDASAEIRPIGTSNTSDVHLVQVLQDMPQDSCMLQWLTSGNAEHTVFIPSFSGITDTIDEYKADGSAYQEDSAYWAFKRIATLAEQDRERLGQGVRDFWEEREDEEIARVSAQMDKIRSAYKYDRDAGRAYVTKIAAKEAKRQLKNADVLYTALMFAASLNTSDNAPYYRGDPGSSISCTFTKPVALIEAAEAAGYQVKDNDDTLELTKDGQTCVLTVGATSVYIADEYANDLSYPTFEVDGTVYGPADFADSLCVPEE